MRRVIVSIDSLVLKGFRYEDRHRVAAALKAELTRVLAQPGAAERLTELGSAPQLRLDNVNVAPNAIPQQVGAETARAIGRGLAK
jgi:hypothetical protein